jgi:Na+-transporting NADH:ubiquinone oxidoreductase subunit NqrE
MITTLLKKYIKNMINKVVIFILIFSILNILKEGFMFYKSMVERRSNMTTKRLWGIGLSLAYILTIIFTGIGF